MDEELAGNQELQETETPTAEEQEEKQDNQAEEATDDNTEGKDTNEENQETESEEEKKEEEINEDDISVLNKYQGKLKDAFPDKEFESEEDLQESLDLYIEDLEKKYKEKSDQIQGLNKIFEERPVFLSLMDDIDNGATEIEAIARNFDEKALREALDSKDKKVSAEWARGKVEREKRLAEQKKRQETLEININESSLTFDAFVKENNLGNKKSEFERYVEQHVTDIIAGKVSKDLLSALYKASNYDNDVGEAKKLGELQEKNKKIIMRKKREKEEGDGLPNIKGGQKKQSQPKPRTVADEFFGGLDNHLKDKQRARE